MTRVRLTVVLTITMTLIRIWTTSRTVLNWRWVILLLWLLFNFSKIHRKGAKYTIWYGPYYIRYKILNAFLLLVLVVMRTRVAIRLWLLLMRLLLLVVVETNIRLGRLMVICWWYCDLLKLKWLLLGSYKCNREAYPFLSRTVRWAGFSGLSVSRLDGPWAESSIDKMYLLCDEMDVYLQVEWLDLVGLMEEEEKNTEVRYIVEVW